jgi:hypothetical protein
LHKINLFFIYVSNKRRFVDFIGAIEIPPISKESMENTEQAQIPEVADQAVEPHEKTPQTSFAELRKAKEDAERREWQAKKELELMQKQMQSQMPQQQTQEPEYDYRQLEQEEFPDGKKLVKALGTLDKKLSSYDEKLAEKDLKIQALEFAVEHSDFKDIVTAENIEKYIKSDEDNQEAVQKASNPLRKVYNLIKKELEKQDLLVSKQKYLSQEQKRVDEKESKPQTGSLGVRSAAVTVAAQMSNSKMTKEQKIALWKETMAAARS